MRCEQCGNEEAVIQLTTVVDSEMQILHLCEACAAKQGVQTGAAPGTEPLADFLAQIGKSVGEGAAASGRCPSCGLTPAQLKQTGRMGCADCYAHFDVHLRGLLRRLHGATQHVGKVAVTANPGEADRKARAESLRRSLRRAVEAEDFEHAAALRDEIRRLESSE
ncbi:MAG TPA: UvrB/UvrC motif-containing protein [Longimicrobiaceae bacterium]|nr:UvrB/UvrC motif-containing protein [Longimicrobiaceae bacterium]